MLSHRATRLAGITLAAGITLLALPQIAAAAPPVCANEVREFFLPAGLTRTNPPPPCTDADGDALTIKVMQDPAHGTLDPPGSAPAETPRTYTADANAVPGTVDTMTFRAVDSNEEESGDFTIAVTILAPDETPVCDDLDLTVQSGQSVAVPFACTDPDGPDVTLTPGTPAHGTLAGGSYTPAAGFTGTDTITYSATDSWDVGSDDAVVTITVTPAPSKPQPQPLPKVDNKAPSLALAGPASLSSLRRAFRLTATTDEAGRLTVHVFVSAATARRYKIDKHAASRVLVGTVVRDVAAGANTIKVKLTPKARKRLKHAKGVKLRVIATIADVSGNDRTRRAHITGQP